MTKNQEEFIGTRFKHPKFGYYEVISYSHSDSLKKAYFNVRFDETGYITKALKSGIERGNIKDKYNKTVCNFGYIGDIDVHEHNKEYRLWNHIIQRCYSERELRRNPSYVDVVVCDEWAYFGNFLRDIQQVENYDRWKNGELMHIDKDKKSGDSKIYSLSTCIFLTPTENLKLVNTKIIHEKEKVEFEYKKLEDVDWIKHLGIKDLCNKMGFYESSIRNCIIGKQNQHKGYNFRRTNMPKSKIVALVSETCGGKDTIAKELINKFQWNLAVSLTTRPIRDTETNGVEYNFVTNEEFDRLVLEDKILEKTEYNPNGERWQYGLSKDCFKDDMTNIAIVNPHGMKQLMSSQYKDRIIIFKIDCPLEERITRYLNRDAITNIKKVELIDRILKDIEDFDGFADNYSIVKIYNDNNCSISDIANEIKKKVRYTK